MLPQVIGCGDPAVPCLLWMAIEDSVTFRTNPGFATLSAKQTI